MLDIGKINKRNKEYVLYGVIPEVIIDNKNKVLISRWIIQHGCPIDMHEEYALSLLFYKLGFNKEDVIYIRNIDYIDNSFVRFNYSVNTKDYGDLDFISMVDRNPMYGKIFSNKLIVSDSMNNKLWCDCYWDYNGISLDVYKKQENIGNNEYFVCTKDRGSINYDISLNNDSNSRYKFQLYVGAVVLDKDCEFMLENEDVVEDYIKKLEFPVSIIDIYKDLSKIINIDKYKIKIKFIKNDKVDGHEIILDEINLFLGILESLMITKGNKTIGIKGLNDNVSWSYMTSLLDGNISIVNGKQMSINFNSLNQDSMENLFDFFDKSKLDEVKNEVLKVRKLAKENFYK